MRLLPRRQHARRAEALGDRLAAFGAAAGIGRQAVQRVAAAFAQDVGLGGNCGGDMGHRFVVSLRLPMVARLPQNITRLLRASCAAAATVLAVIGGDPHRDTVAGSSTTEHRAATTTPSAAATPSPTTLAAATTQPTTEPPANRPRAAMMIDERRYEFPAAILRIKPKNDRLLVLLMSDDPKDALDENYNGNSFYLEMPVEAADVKELSSAVWHYVAPSSDRTDTPDGIF